MKRDLFIAVMCSGLLGCSAQTGKAISDNVHDGMEDAKETAAEVGATVQAHAELAGEHAAYFGDAFEQGFYSATDHIADWMKPTVPKPPRPIAASYCYHVYEDILCYRQPMPNAETRLAGYQPPGAPSPPEAVMQPLPRPVADASQLPVNRVASAKPVFGKMSASMAGAEKTPEDGTLPPSEAMHEELPDPATAPQL